MKRLHIAVAIGLLGLSAGCQNYLDVNTNPNAPQSVSANLYLPPMLHWMATAPAYDGRFLGHYTQQWYSTSVGFSPGQTWGKMGFDPSSDNGAEQWRDVYWSLGQNLVDMNAKAATEQRWDVLGVGQVLKAWGWEVLTDMHGEIIIKEAFDPTRTTFDYDDQQYAYFEVDSLLKEAITNLQRTDGAVNTAYLGASDRIYNGDRTKWLKFAYGLLAMSHNHFSNKATYNPADVIALVDKAFVGNADDALLQYTGSSTDNQDFNFLGPRRDNLTRYRQTQFVVNLMNGTDFGVTDPRMSRMLSLTAAQQPNNFFGYPGLAGAGLQSRYIFGDRTKLPIMTYAQLQFVKAEAAYRMGDKPTALAAYRNGVNASIDFVNARNLDDNQAVTQISGTERATFLAAPTILPATPAGLTLTMIMSQKYIAQWAWGHNELFMDMRRYHWTDIDPASGTQVYPGFTPPAVLYVLNAGKVVQRVRPRYNSEYVWNIPGLTAIGGLADDYHTKPLWITQP
jgi:hypothetical protein